MKNFLILLCLLFVNINLIAQTDCNGGPCYFDTNVHGQPFKDIFGLAVFIPECIEDGVIKDTEITLDGHFLIHTNVTFDNVVINMTEGSSININSIPRELIAAWGEGNLTEELVNSVESVEVNFINGTIIRGCDKMWKGITFSTLLNKAGPDVNFDQVEIRDAYKAITTHNRTNLHLNEVDFIDNYLGLEANQYRDLDVINCTFVGQNLLKPPYAGLALNSNVANYGIISNLADLFTFMNSSSSSTMTNLKCGIKCLGSSGSSSLVVRNQTFINNDTCIYLENSSNVTLIGNEMSYNSIGIAIKNPEENIRINIGLGGQNTLTCISPLGLGYSGIYLQNVQNANNVFVQSNIIGGHNIMGINLDRINADNYLINDNTVNDALIGINLRRNTITGTLNRIRSNHINNSVSTPMVLGISANKLEGSIIELNNVTDNNTSGFSTYGISLNGNSHDNFLGENTVQAQNSYIGISLEQNMMNDLCCNSSSGAGTDLRIKGTNASTELRNSILGSARFKLNQTSIGTQEHVGNRWDEGSQGILTNTNITQAVSNNLFLVNNIESNSTNGRIRPESISPSNITNTWFVNDIFGSSKLCMDPSNTDCGLENGPMPIIPPVLGDYVPGPCASLSLDIDNDGVCDDIDPDPLDACIPYNIDSDNDGVCDGIDRNPSDGNLPYSADSDGDGTSDTVDPDILNPCIPNGLDQDNDGVCAYYDPDDLDPLVPITPSTIPPIIKDINGNYFNTSSIKFGKPSRTLHQLEQLADLVFGSHEYELVNAWENEYTLLNFLLHNQYYLSISDKLNNYWVNKTSNSRIWEYVFVDNNVENYAKMQNDELHKLILKRAYLSRINNMMDYYTENYDSLFLETLIQYKQMVNSDIKDIISNSDQLKTAQRNQVRLEINNLLSPEVFQATQKEVWLKELNHDEGILSSTDLLDLTSLAYLCPLEYGTGVYSAQSLLLQYESLDLYNFTDLCQNSNNKLSTLDNHEIKEIKIYPNPTRDLVRLEAQNVILKLVISQNGKILEVFNPNQLDTSIDLSKYTSGVFQIKITTENNTVVKQVLKIQ